MPTRRAPDTPPGLRAGICPTQKRSLVSSGSKGSDLSSALMKRQSPTAPRPLRAERVDVALPVHLADRIGLTRNISVGGIYFEMDAAAEAGSEISFDIEMETPLGKMMLRCSGQIVRTEEKGKRSGIAVRIVESRLEATEN